MRECGFAGRCVVYDAHFKTFVALDIMRDIYETARVAGGCIMYDAIYIQTFVPIRRCVLGAHRADCMYA